MQEGVQQLRAKQHLAAETLPAANDLRQSFRAVIKASLITGMIKMISTDDSLQGYSCLLQVKKKNSTLLCYLDLY